MVRVKKIVDAPMHGVFQNFGGLKGSRLFIEARFDVSKSIYIQARDGYITGHVAELQICFRWTDSPTSSTSTADKMLTDFNESHTILL